MRGGGAGRGVGRAVALAALFVGGVAGAPAARAQVLADTTAAPPVAAPPPRPAPRDEWLGRDKALHAGGSFLLTLSGQYVLVSKGGLSEDGALPLSARRRALARALEGDGRREPRDRPALLVARPGRRRGRRAARGPCDRAVKGGAAVGSRPARVGYDTSCPYGRFGRGGRGTAAVTPKTPQRGVSTSAWTTGAGAGRNTSAPPTAPPSYSPSLLNLSRPAHPPAGRGG